jgi:Chondroitinase B
MIKDLPPDWGSNETITSMSDLRTAIDNRDWEKGHIVLEGTLKLGRRQNGRVELEDRVFPNLKSEDIQRPVVIKARRIGGATIEGEGSLEFRGPKNLWLYGINFKYKTGTEDKENGVRFRNAENCKIVGCDFEIKSSRSEYNYLTLRDGDSNCIAYNKFHDKRGSTGQFISIGGDSGCTRTVIEYNHFKNLTGVSNKGEAIFIGGSELARVPLKTIVRFNLFENCEGDKECITNKSCCNIYHHNTFRGNNGSLSLRHGSGNIVRDNIFLPYSEGANEGLSNNGIRVYGNQQTIENNYFKCKRISGSALLRPIIIGNGNWGNDPTREELEGMSSQKRRCLDNSPEESKRHSAYAQVKGSRFEKNIIVVDSSENNEDDVIVIWGHDTGEGNCTSEFKPKSNRFENNMIIAKSGTMFKIGDDATVDDNIFSRNKLHKEDGGSAKKGNMPDNGITIEPPMEEERRERKGLEEKHVGPFSELSDQGHCGREELSSLTGARCS